jgi:ABC-2 type transport system ATP-binding protein
MIEAINLTKKFDDFTALKSLNCKIPKGCIYGLVGSNGAGKSTFLRLITGIYKPEGGSVTLDGTVIYENYDIKKKMVFVPDELYFLPQSSMNRMSQLYSAVYEDFSFDRFKKLTEAFNLSPKKNINSFSKGMKRQAAIILALSSMPDYIFFDETFDGLDPVKRNLVKKVLYSDICERGATAVLTSHSLRELEDTCDQLALLHDGGILFESDIQNLKTSLFKMQLAFDHDFSKKNFCDIEILSYTQKGSVANLIVRGEKDKITQNIRKMNPILLDILALSLEEVFIYEMEAVGYVPKDIIM